MSSTPDLSRLTKVPAKFIAPELSWLLRNWFMTLILAIIPVINLFISFDRPENFYISSQTILSWVAYFGSGILVISWVQAIKLGYNQLLPIRTANRMAIMLGLLFGFISLIWAVVFNLKLQAGTQIFNNPSLVSFYSLYPEISFFNGLILAIISTAVVFLAYLLGQTGIRAIVFLLILPSIIHIGTYIPGILGFYCKLISFSNLALSNTYGDLTNADSSQLYSLLLLLRQGFWPEVNAQKTEGVLTISFLVLLAMLVWLPFYSFNRYKIFRAKFFHTNTDYFSVIIISVLGILAPPSTNAVFNLIYYSIFGIGLGWRYGCTIRVARVIDIRIIGTFMALFVGFYYHHGFQIALFNSGVILLVSSLTSLIALRESKQYNQGITTTSLMLIGLFYITTLSEILLSIKLSDVELETPIIAALILWLIIKVYESRYLKSQRLRMLV